MAGHDDRSSSGTHGVELHFVCGSVPVVSMDPGSVFHEYASALLQAALKSDRKAASLYTYNDDADLVRECKGRLGYQADEVMGATLTQEGLREVRAVGTTKRAVMLALVVAVAVRPGAALSQLRELLQFYHLDERFKEIVAAGKGGGRGASGSRTGPAGEPPTPGPPNGGAGAGRPGGAAEPQPRPAKRQRRTRPKSPAAQEVQQPAAERAEPQPAKRQQRERSPSPPAQEVRQPAAADAVPLRGSCPEVERPYVRSTAERRASAVRPVPVLRKSFVKARASWQEKRDWVSCGDQLWAIRQDLTTQMVRSPFAVEVYEFSARAALEAGDFRHFELCSSQLEELYDEHAAKNGARPPSAAEFAAYRLLWLMLHGERLALASFLRRRARELRSGDPHVRLAAAFRGALEGGHLLRACRLVAPERSAGPEPAAGAAMARLLALLLEQRGTRLRLLAEACRAAQRERPPALLALLRRLFPSGDGAALRGLPLARTDGPPGVDGRATAERAEELLGEAHGARPRLGEASSEHMQGFIRAGRPA